MDWGHAAEIAGVGLGVVVLILGILALVIWLVGLGVQRTTKNKEKGDGEKDEKKPVKKQEGN